ncbi:ATP-dependent RNA helicase YqfR [Furfurilactobacillus rossiae]|uniref:DEAD/DEAH box helicase n=1 Tax=Furfurilactobacillus rossiae TaxID=231049 RepID=UPI0015B8EC94|nr:DEAD/DEAH box helicase [Furfurilactobacillus rossiae]MCF6166525.1 DEAD/DEAH box helicase [Furfurilactobacillus rossiae]QLE64568.1 ATP-dependent RNA helicase YqfR [Furfurilactobacillus rossiae]
MTETFKDLQLRPELLEALQEISFVKPTPVQAKLIPVILGGRSVVGQSQTGSGKTHAFLLPIFDQLKVDVDEVQAIIATPSRELASQIYEDAKQLAGHFKDQIRIANYVGGTDRSRQERQLDKHQPQVVIGTPGRLRDFMEEHELDLHTAHQFVIDEADMTLDMGFLKDVDKIAGALPKDLQMMVFSATIPQKLQPFLKKYLTNPVVEEIPVTSIISPTIDNWLISTKGKQKDELIYELLTMGEPYLVLVFCNTKQRTAELTAYLKGRGLKVAMISGDVQARERKRVMKQVQNLDYQYVVATDLAARGIDIKGVSHVINDDIPHDLDFFIHRVGRTGRNGMPGIAITLYKPGEENEIAEIEKLGVKFAPKDVRHGEVVDSYDRNRRFQRTATHEKLDPTLVGMVKKKKKKIKPGYKHQIKTAIKRKAQADKRIEMRESARSQRRQNRRQGESQRSNRSH